MEKIFALVKEKLKQQDTKWGEDRILDSHFWMTIIGEEFGEACHASLEHDPDNYLEELIDIAASAIAAIHSHILDQEASGYNILNTEKPMSEEPRL